MSEWTWAWEWGGLLAIFYLWQFLRLFVAFFSHFDFRPW